MKTRTKGEKASKVKKFDFYRALKLMLEGNKISRSAWRNSGYYGFLKNGQVNLHKIDGRDYAWIIGNVDIMGKDYFIVK